MKLALWGTTNLPPEGLDHVQSYHRQIDEIALADELGFEHYWLYEHHITPGSPMPSPNLMIAAAARETQRIRLGTLVNVLPYRHPLMLAEELAMLDVLTNGRVDCGIGRGIKPLEFRAFGQDQELSREAFLECLEVMKLVWSDQPFTHKGKYYTCEKQTPLSPPLVQKPHPPLYVSAQSPQSIRWAASQDMPFGQIDALVDEAKRDLELYRAVQAEHGFAPAPRLFLNREIHVAETDAEAIRAAKPYLIRQWEMWNRYTQFALAGEMPDSYDLWRKHAPRLYALTFEEIAELGLTLIGSPETVLRRILDQEAELDLAMMAFGFRFGGMQFEMAERSMRLFAAAVMPELRRRTSARPAAEARSEARAK
jgi:alkanesulfonate monooxygenase SsuD/methylene tetrahydromethanopterin reductase-like flavin-dependent oxidoreductase (luciferase family)